MSKILTSLILVSFLALLVAPVAMAQVAPQECCVLQKTMTLGGTTCTAGSVVGPVGGVCSTAITCTTPAWGMFCLLNTIYNITDWIFIILVAISAVFVIWGGVTIVTSAGNPEKVTSGRNYIVYAAIGLAVALLSKAVPSIVKLVIGT